MHPSIGTCSTSTIHPCNSFLGWNCYKRRDLYGENDWNSSMILWPNERSQERSPWYHARTKQKNDQGLQNAQNAETIWNNTDHIHRVAFNILQSCCHSLNLNWMEQSDVWTNSLPWLNCRGGVAKVMDFYVKTASYDRIGSASRWCERKSLVQKIFAKKLESTGT